MYSFDTRRPGNGPRGGLSHGHCLAAEVMVGAAAQEGAYLLVAEMVKALEDPSRRRGAADAIVLFCTAPKYDIQEHLTPILTVRLVWPHPRQACTPLESMLGRAVIICSHTWVRRGQRSVNE